MKCKYFFPLLVALMTLLFSCSIKYGFRGTNLSPDVKSITVNTIENRAIKINPSLSNTITTALMDKYRKLTKLEMLREEGDLTVTGYITSYDVSPTAITADEVASKNRLTVTVKIVFTNKKNHDEDFDKSFVAFQDYDSNLSLDSIEAQLCDQIVETLVEDIFNATVANW
jgi:hypothetical protein